VSEGVGGRDLEELTDAWVYVFGRYLVVRQEQADLAEAGVDYNVLKHNPPVLSGAGAGVAPMFVNPNLDVVYSEAWIAVDENTPALVEVARVPAGIYATAQIVDEWAEITYNINARAMPAHPQSRFALCLAGSDPEIPDGAIRLDVPSAKAKLLARVQIGADLEAAVGLQHGFSVRSPGAPRIEAALPAPAFTNTRPPGAAMFAQPMLDRALAAPDRSGHAEAFRARLERIAAFVAADPANAEQLDQLVRSTVFPAFMKLLVSDLAEVGHGWRSTATATASGATTGFAAWRTSRGSGGTRPARSSITRCRPTRPAIRRPAITTTPSASPPTSRPASTSTAIGR
jgi:hypothetical protein